MNTLKELVKKPSTTIVDVRSPWEFETEHIPGAKNIPLEDVTARINEFKAYKDAVVFYCRSGNRSGMAVSLLKQNGMTNVFNGGGLSDMQYLLN